MSGFQFVGDRRFDVFEPDQRVDDADHHDRHIEGNGFGIRVGKLTIDVEAGADKADPHDRIEDTSGHMENGFFPLRGEHVGDLSHVEDEDGGLDIGAEQRHVGDSRDVNAQEQGSHGDEVVDKQVFVSGLVLGVQGAKLLGQPAVVREHDERNRHRADQTVERGGSSAQRAAGHEEDVLRSGQEVVGDDAQRLVGDLVERQDARAHDAHEGKKDGDREGRDGAGERDVTLGIFGLRRIGHQGGGAHERVGQQGRGGKQALDAARHPAFAAEEGAPVDLGQTANGEPDERQQQGGTHDVLRLGHEVDAKEIEQIEECNHKAGDQFFIAASHQLAEVKGKGLSIEGEAHLTKEIDGQVEAAPFLAEEEVTLCVSAADQSDTGAHEEGRDGCTDDPHGGAQIGDANGASGLCDAASGEDQDARADDDSDRD